VSGPAGVKAGFALPAVLVVVAMLALVFLSAVSALDTLARQTLRAKERVRFEQAALSVEARTAWLVATEPLGADAIMIGAPRTESDSRLDTRPRFDRRAVTPLRLDGRIYLDGDAREPLSVSLQDAAGQLNLDLLPEPAKARLVAALGAPPADQARLVDRWADWLDADDLKRLNGAESPDYATAGRAAPRNGSMTRTSEILGVLGWAASAPRERWLALRDSLTVDPLSGDFNVNTASPDALGIMLGLTGAQLEAALAARAVRPFLSMADFTAAVGPIPFDSEASYARPNGRFAVRVASPARNLVFRARIVLTPQSPERPLWIEERAISTAGERERTQPPADALPFPALSR
jgi:general secretion pathway protein K